VEGEVKDWRWIGECDKTTEEVREWGKSEAMGTKEMERLGARAKEERERERRDRFVISLKSRIVVS
jgi:hypothetical protein